MSGPSYPRLWIAAVAAANNLAIMTQDGDYDPLAAIGGPRVIASECPAGAGPRL